jgi:hypothetical protein
MIGRLGAKLLYKILMGMYNIGTGKHSGFMRFVKYDGYALLLIFISDIHKYGAWYLGNSTGYWKSWAYFVIPVMTIPFVIYVMAKLTVWVVKTNRYRMFMAGFKALCIWLVSLLVFGDIFFIKVFPDPGYFYGFIRSDGQFWITLIIGFILWGVLPFCVFYFFLDPEKEV